MNSLGMSKTWNGMEWNIEYSMENRNYGMEYRNDRMEYRNYGMEYRNYGMEYRNYGMEYINYGMEYMEKKSCFVQLNKIYKFYIRKSHFIFIRP
jgi:hypothetical protein